MTRIQRFGLLMAFLVLASMRPAWAPTAVERVVNNQLPAVQNPGWLLPAVHDKSIKDFHFTLPAVQRGIVKGTVGGSESQDETSGELLNSGGDVGGVGDPGGKVQTGPATQGPVGR